MFRETVTHADGTLEGAASEQHALTLLARARRRGYTITLTRQGGAHMAWMVSQFGQSAPAHRSITLHPQLTFSRALTDSTVYDLGLIATTGKAVYDPIRRDLDGGLWRIPQAATARLRARGLIVVDGRNRVRQSLTARIALHMRDHRTSTTNPSGPYYPPGGGAIRYDTGAAALCTCGFARHGVDRDEARRHNTAHLTEISGEFISAVTAVSTVSTVS